MKPQLTKPVFYDPSGRRAQIGHHFLRLLFFIIVLFVSIFLLSIVLQPILPLPDVFRRSVDTHFFHKSPLRQAIDAQKTELKIVTKNETPAAVAPEFSQTINLSAYAVEWDDGSRYSLKQNLSKIETLIPEELTLTDTGIALTNPLKFQQTLALIAKRNVNIEVIPLINNYDERGDAWNTEKLHRILATPESRFGLIDALFEFVDLYKLDGVNIDFENLDTATFPLYYDFLQELSLKFHPSNLKVLVNVPFDNDSYDYPKIASFVDTVVVMAYDEHWMNNNPGPIASEAWFLKNLKAIIAKIPKEKLSLAIGNYGYDWEKWKNGQAVTFEEANTLLRESDATMEFDPVSMNPHFTYYDDADIEHQVWYLDAVTAYNEIIEASKAGVDNIILWRLGSEDPSFWKLLSRNQLEENIKPSALESFSAWYGIDYEGSGEIYRVSGAPSEGVRSMTYLDNHISNEFISKNPLPYQITRYAAGSGKVISLTFDDGPDPTYTPQILDILKEKKVPATFFIVGENAEMHPDILKRAYNEGHLIGNHTFTHPDISASSSIRTDLEFDITERLIQSILWHDTILFRPPYGEDVEPESPDQVAPLLKSNSLWYVTVGMKIDPSDWQKPGVDKIIQNTLTQADNGRWNIVLLHDGGGDRSETVAALPGLIDTLRNAGYTIVALNTLLGIPSDHLMPKVSGIDSSLQWSDHLIFTFIYFFSWVVYIVFIFGLILGLFRFFLVTTFAVVHYFFRKKSYFDPQYKPSVTIIIPAYNEEKVIQKTIESVMKGAYQNFSVVVVDDGSTDLTLKNSQDTSLKYQNIQVFTKSNAGKGEAINYGISRSDSDIIIIIDADTLFHPLTMSRLVRHFSDQSVGAVAGNVKVGNRHNLITKLQAVEYVTNQNLDRRAFDVLNAITVVPGAVGAWRRESVERVGGFSGDTLAEDSDLTFSILRLGYRILHEESAYAYTEAPETIRSLLKQRFRWSFGVLQVSYKHIDILSDRRVSPSLRWLVFPQMIIFQLLFPLFSPIIDISVVGSLLFALMNYLTYGSIQYLDVIEHIVAYGCIFITLDMIVWWMAVWMEKDEKMSLLAYFPIQRFFYKWMMYFLSIQVLWSACTGKVHLWNKIDRKNSVSAL